MRPFTMGGRPHLGLLGKFAIASLIPIVLLAVVLAQFLQGAIRDRALVNARQSASLLERTLIEPELAQASLSKPLPTSEVARLDRRLQPSLDGNPIASIKVWNRNGLVIYASEHAIIGKRFAPSDELHEALEGSTASEVSNLTAAENASDRRFGKLLEVYTPLQRGSGAPIEGAFELYLPYLPIQAAITHDTQRVSVILLAGVALLYLVLYRIVASASTRLRRQATENEHLALYDALTNLPNRTLFQDRASQAILTTDRLPGKVGLMLIDLDRFREINDTLGHHNGDLLLKEIGQRLTLQLREGDTVARLGGDEFGVLLPRVADQDAARAVAEKVRESLREPFVLEGIALDVGSSVGVALYPDHGNDVETLLQRADVAMYVAKQDHSGCEVYSAGRDEYSPARLSLVGELRRAIDCDELVLYYQPKADLQTGDVVGVEALVRWQHPEQGLIGPDAFIPLAERTGLIRDLTHAVVDAALRQARAWQDEGIDLSVAVNLSARDLLDLELPETVKRLLAQHAVAPERLELEITESVILADPMRARAVLSRLDAMGVQLAIDDFGVGYSSLAYLKRLPVGEIKIDRSFVMNMENDDNDRVIVRSTIDLGRNLGLRVVAEGVEDEATWDALAALNCDQAQGYWLSRPVPADQIAAWLDKRSAAPAQPVATAADQPRRRSTL